MVQHPLADLAQTRRAVIGARTALCREGWYWLLLLLVALTWALLRENNLLLFVAGLMTGALLINWRLSKGLLRRMEVRHRIAGRPTAGRWIEVEVEIVNRSPRLPGWAVAVEDCVAPDSRAPRAAAQAAPLRPQLVFAYIPSGGRRRLTYRLRLPVRGPYTLGPCRLSTRYPLGLVRRTLWLDVDQRLLVLPRLGQLRKAWRRDSPPTPCGARGARRPGAVPGDVFAVREWQPGDSVRWVDWRSTARHGQLIVRQFEQPGEQRLAVLLDLWQPALPTSADAWRIELAVSFAGTLLDDFRARRGAALLAIAAAQPVCLAGRTGGPFSREALTALALATACPAPPLATAWSDLRERLGLSGELVVISTRPDIERALADLRRGAWSASAAATRPAAGFTDISGLRQRTIRVDGDGARLAEFFRWEDSAEGPIAATPGRPDAVADFPPVKFAAEGSG